MEVNTVYHVIEELRSTGSRNEKIRILEEHRDLPHLKKFFIYALDEMKVFGIKKIPEYDSSEPVNLELEDAFILLDSLQARTFTGNKAINMLSDTLSQMSENDADVLKLMIQKDPDCGVNHSTVNKVWGKGTVPKFEVMLCAKKSEKVLKKMHWPAIAQIKYDGMRVVFIVDPLKETVTAHTRSGRVIDLFGLFDGDLLDAAKKVLNGPVMFDGELIAREDGHLVSRKTSNGIINKCLKGTATKDLLDPFVFVCWDLVPLKEFKEGAWEMPYEDRYENLVSAGGSHARLEIADSYTVRDENELDDLFRRVIGDGLEGLILKNPLEGWEGKRVNHHIKYKAELEADLEVDAVVEGEGKYRGMLGHLVVRSRDGGLVAGVGTGFSDEQRREYFTNEMEGKIVSVKYNEVIDKKDQDTRSLFLPVFVEVREDKTEADDI